MDRGGWWVVVGEQSCRDWSPVSQVIILEEKGDWRGKGVQPEHRLPHQLKFKVRDVGLLFQSRFQMKMDSIYPVQYPVQSSVWVLKIRKHGEPSPPCYIELGILAQSGDGYRKQRSSSGGKASPPGQLSWG